MFLARTMTAVAASALMAGAAFAQAVPGQTARPAPVTPPAPMTQATPPTTQAASPPVGADATASTTGALPTVASGDLVATAQAAGQFSTLLKAAEATGLTPVLKGAGPITIFAPTDAAFAALPAGELDRLMRPENAQELQRLLANHVVNARVASSNLAGRKGTVPAVGGATLEVDGASGQVVVNGARVVRADVPATNGVIHVVDRVILAGVPASSAAAAGTPVAPADAAGANASANVPPNP